MKELSTSENGLRGVGGGSTRGGGASTLGGGGGGAGRGFGTDGRSGSITTLGTAADLGVVGR